MHTFKALLLSFFSRSFYADTFHSGKGVGILLILLLVLVQTLVMTFQMQKGLNEFTDSIAPEVVRQIPPITFSGGKAFTPQSHSYEVREPKSGQLIAIIDTMAEYPPADLGGALIFVAQKSVTMKKSEYEQRTYDYSGIQELVIDESVIHFWLNLLKRWGAVVGALFVFPFLGIYRALQWLFFSLITLAIAAILEISGSYAAKLRVTALALTPPLVLNILAVAFNVDFPGISILFFAVTCTYLFLGVQAASSLTNPKPAPQGPPPFLK